MKTLLLALLLVSGAANATPQETFCLGVYDLAELVMNGRQQGVSMKKAIEIVSDSGNEQLTSIAEIFIDDAYREPMFNSEQYKQAAVNRFAEKAFYECKDVVR